MYHILIVDDDERICSLLSRILKKENYSVTAVHNTPDADTHGKETFFDAILTDVKMEPISGILFTEAIRSGQTNFPADIPIIMISAGLETTQKITGLKIGADDYLVKPFEVEELLVRLKNILKRTGKVSSYIVPQEGLSVGDYAIDPVIQTFFFKEKSIKLTENETNILAFLLQNPNISFSRDQLNYRFFKEHLHIPQSRALDVMIARIRKKISGLLGDEENGDIPLITLRNKGYIWKQ